MPKVDYKKIYTKKYFDERPDLNGAENSGHFYGYSQWVATELDFDSVLDIGFGYGWFVKCLHGLGFNVSGCDISTYIIDIIQTENPQLSLYQDELPLLKNTDKGFDLVVCYHVLEHLTANDARKSIKRLIQIANKYVLIVVPMKDVGDRSGIAEPTHRLCHPRKWWEAHFEKEQGKLLNLKYGNTLDCSIIFQKGM